MDVNDDALSGPPLPDPTPPPGRRELLALWTALVDDLPLQQRVWLSASRPLALHEGMALIAVPDDFTKARLEGRLRTWLEDTLTTALGSPVRLAVSVDPELEPVVLPSDVPPDASALPVDSPTADRHETNAF